MNFLATLNASARPLTAKRKALVSVSTTALLIAASHASAFAQSQTAAAETPQTAQAPVEEIVVTGTHIISNGYQAPTPVTVVGVAQLETQASVNIADYLNTMPAFAGSTVPNATNASMSAGTNGGNFLNLRNLGPQRVLVLLDGQRSVGINTSQEVDVNLIPQALVSRIDVEQGGGASAIYGSDAIAGVVNFILDKNFTGVKGDVSGGVTTYGDDRQWKVSLTAGTGFADDKGHFLISGTASHQDGIPIANRPWNLTGLQFMANPANPKINGLSGTPQWLLQTQTSQDNAPMNATIITSGPLKGVAFGPGGTPFQYQYGYQTFDPDTAGSPDFAATQCRGTICGGGLTSEETTQSVFTRFSYDIADNVNAYIQVSWAHNSNYNWCCTPEDDADITVKSGNPFIPASIQSQMTALGLTTITMGSQDQDLPPIAGHTDRRTGRYVVGANGKFDAMDTSWTWNAYYQKGVSYQHVQVVNALYTPNYYLAIDAVTGPNGQIECRSTLTNPTNGCVPYNPFGVGVSSQAAINYVQGAGALDFRDEKFTQDVEEADVTGSPFSDWAGPISIAMGVAHRTEHVTGINDPTSATAFNWWAGNYRVEIAGYNVTEGNIEAEIPLAKNVAWAEDLSLHAAARGTGYSTSGYVTTWSVGATYQPIDDIKFRANRSKDIRAPNLLELFAPGSGGFPGLTNPFLGGITENNIPVNTIGNANLKPEEAANLNLGVVVQPTFIPGFTASVDYFNININNAIGTLSAQNIINDCYNGNAALCSAISFGPNQYGPNAITALTNQPFNLVNRLASGVDFDATYTLRLTDLVASWNGATTFHIAATRYIQDWINDGIDPAINSAGSNATSGPPTWRYTGSVTYTDDPMTLTLTGRGLSSGTYNNAWIQCTTSCPVSTAAHTTVSNNHLAGAFYLDVATSYQVAHKSDTGADVFMYLNISNLANKDPAIVAQNAGGYNYSTLEANGTLYDTLGRTFLAGVRFKM